jgi:hypothetical protein
MTFNWDTLKKILIRALHTAAQVAASMFTIGLTIKEVDWMRILSVSLVAAVYSIVKSLAVGIPESGIVEGTMTIDDTDPEDPLLNMDLGEDFDVEALINKKVFKMNIVRGAVPQEGEEENQNGSENEEFEED